MTTAIAQDSGRLKINFIVHQSESSKIPKQIQIMDSELTQKESFWIHSNEAMSELSPGIYVIRISMPSGMRIDKAVEISKGKETLLSIDISTLSPRENQEWAYFTKSSAGTNPEKKRSSSSQLLKSKLPITGVSVRLWHLENGEWKFEDEQNIQNVTIDEVGWSYTFSTPKKIELLQVTGNTIQPRCVMLPPCSSVQALIKLAEGPPEVVHPLDITVSTNNYEAESLLALITSGSIGKAKLLYNAQAVDLFYHKISDPAAAAVGGYYLLKVGELKSMHGWAANLAGLFDWFPDGAIIYASQLMQDENENNIEEIRKWLITAAKRGIPIYTEGLRLLYEGLMTLWFDSEGEDREVENSLQMIKKYVEHADFSQETTTFTGKSPTEPGAEKRRKL